MKYLTTILFAAFSLSLAAQSYNTVAGLRLGTEWGLTVKQRVYDNWTAEMLVQSSLVRDETTLTILAANHNSILSRHFNIYAGGGLHFGWVGDSASESATEATGNPFGLDGIIGLEMTIGNINFSYDFKPALNLTGGEKTLYTQTAVSIRYRFWKRDKLQWEKSKKRRERERRRRQRRKN